MYGDRNTGKSTFFEFLEIIFCCIDYSETSGRFDMRYKGGKYEPCFILIDEGALKKFFSSPDKYPNSKRFFEGKGLVSEIKMKDPKRLWRKVPIIAASNRLPFIIKK